MNEEVAGALGLSATYQKVSVNVLNEKVERFDSMPVDSSLESCDRNVNLPFKALTCPRRVTGNYKIVDVLIDLHFSRCDVKGNPGEPIARLGPLGWSCVGHPDRKSIAGDPQRNLAYTLFCRPQVFDEINDSLKRFWEIETLGIQQSKPEVMTTEEKIAFEKVSQSLVHDGE